MKHFIGILLLSTLILAGCTDDAPSAAAAPGLVGVTVNKYVSIGNSLTAGYQSSGLFADGQQYSFPNLFAGRLKAAGASLGTFEQPIWGNPGSPDSKGKAARLEILSWPTSGPVIGQSGAAAGTAQNAALNRPYDNLGIPAAKIADFLDTTDFTTKYITQQNPFFPHVLRNKSYGTSVFDQARRITPKADIITFWLGNNDVLLFAVYGGAAVVSGNVVSLSPTSTAAFAAEYTRAFDSLRAAFPTAKIIAGNIPNISAIPHFTTVGPAVAAQVPFPISYQKHGTRGTGDGTINFNSPQPPLLPLGAGSYVSEIGKATGKWYRDNGVAIPPGIDTTQMFGIDFRNPIPDALILDSLEIAMCNTALTAYNQTIATVTAAKGAALVDVNTIFNDIHRNGLKIGPMTFTTEYIAGGLFSLDGIHPSSRGAGVMANEFIKVMNAKYGMRVGLVDVVQLPGIPAPLKKYAAASLLPKFGAADIARMAAVWR